MGAIPAGSLQLEADVELDEPVDRVGALCCHHRDFLSGVLFCARPTTYCVVVAQVQVDFFAFERVVCETVAILIQFVLRVRARVLPFC